MRHLIPLASTSLLAALCASVACGTVSGNGPGSGGDNPDVNLGDSGLNPDLDQSLTDSGQLVDNPTTCADAAASESYIGCEFWPTVLANPVFIEFDFAVVIANPQAEVAKIDVTGPDGFATSVEIAPGALETIKLPWVSTLKGPEFEVPNTPNGRLTTSLSKAGGAYKVTSSVPVAAYQFNPLQYKKDKGLGEDQCGARLDPHLTTSPICRAASNDASILLPTTALTGNYVVGVYSRLNEGLNWGSVPGAFGITATRDNTEVVVQTSAYCSAKLWPTGEDACIVATPAGSDIEIPELNKDSQLVLHLNAGDVVELVGKFAQDPNVANADVSGTIVHADQPIQVIGFNAIAQVPDANVGNADHLEDTILPAEVIGDEYIVVPPTAFGGQPVGHVVRFFGTVDGTALSYPEGKPAGAPDVINAGEMVQLPAPPTGTPPASCAGTTACYTSESFVVKADKPFFVGSFMLGGDLQSPSFGGDNAAPGDPSFSMMVTPKQFRTDYTFLAPADFEENYADVLIPDGATAIVDNVTVAGATAIGASGWSIARVKLDGSAGGIHRLTTDDPRGVGLQVMGFGSATSFYYPGGLNLQKISEPPVIVIR